MVQFFYPKQEDSGGVLQSGLQSGRNKSHQKSLFALRASGKGPSINYVTQSGGEGLGEALR